MSQIDDVKNFVNTILRFDFDIDLKSGRYAVDAKSIMGIFSLDLSKPIELIAHTEDAEKLFEAIDSYIVK
ncbi:MAG: HPr family phosphocarrier protein [Oscillospiraceae bacterium]|nr:HPr family phosphocarrier protein [Oscillospiraceae bacterium]